MTAGFVATAAVLPSLTLGGGPSSADPGPPPPFGGIGSGSSAPAGTTGSSGPVGDALGSSKPLRLGPAAAPRRVAPEIPLRLSPGGPYIAAPSAQAAPAPVGTLGNSLGLDSGSVRTACVGSAVVGGTGLLLGLLSGSGVLALGSTGSALGSALGSSGSALGGTLGSSGSALEDGLGSSESALGSAAVGSAATGSALLTCLLLLPAPAPIPELPLRIPTLPQIVPVQVRVPAPVPAPARPAPRIVRPRPKYVPPAAPVSQARPPVAWNVLELMTVMVVSVVAGVRVKTTRSGSRG